MTILRTVSHLVAALLLSLACAGTAIAADAAHRPASPSGQSATATVGFRIVIREVLRLDQQDQRLHATAPQTTRTVTTLDGRSLVTVARP